MTTFIDRRLNPRDKSVKNRQRFMERNRRQIKDSIKKIIEKSNVADIGKTKANIRVRGTSEPTFSPEADTGNKKYVLPGNKKFVVGDKQRKEESGSGGRGNKGSPDGEGEDDFEFLLTHDEYLDHLFEEFELPDLVKKKLKETKQMEFHRAGHKSFGTPAQLDLIRSARNGLGRRIGLKRPKNEEIEELEKQIEITKEMIEKGLLFTKEGDDKIKLLEDQIEEMRRRQVAIPWLDPFDVRYRNYVPTPKPVTQAVMFCVMDISGSMGEHEKDLAKRFFILLHLFLQNKYEKVDIVFISHHVRAKEVDEHEFFYSKESGGTIVSSALELTKDIIKDRYNPEDWNIYVAQASDGDNFLGDKEDVEHCMEYLLPLVQYFAYIETTSVHTFSSGMVTDIWQTYKPMSEADPKLNIKKVFEKNQIWKVFAELFAKEKA